MIAKRTIGFLSIIIFGVIGIGFLSFDFISTSAQTSGESNTAASGVVIVYGPDSDAAQQDCINVGGTIHANYDLGQYECILE